MGSVQIPIDRTISARSTETITINNYSGYEGNTVRQVEGFIGGTSKCFNFTCPSSGCDLGEGDTLTVDLNSTAQCS